MILANRRLYLQYRWVSWGSWGDDYAQEAFKAHQDGNLSTLECDPAPFHLANPNEWLSISSFLSLNSIYQKQIILMCK